MMAPLDFQAAGTQARRLRKVVLSMFSVAGLAFLTLGCAQIAVDPGAVDEVSDVSSELLKEAREVTAHSGLVEARDLVAARLAERDDSGGKLEERVIQTTQDPDLVLPDSLAALPERDRERVAMIIIPGTVTGFGGRSMTRPTLRAAARAAEEAGFATHFLETPPRGGVSENASFVANRVAPIFDASDHIIMLALSKGAHDLVFFLQEHAVDLPQEERDKLDLVITLAGTLQGSVVADYFANTFHPVPVTMRTGLHLSGKRKDVAMLKTIARSPWRPDQASRVGEVFPDLTWISMAMVPDGEDGRIRERLWSPRIRGHITKVSPYYSPADGLVESAASILPDEVVVPEWIVRGFGSHAMPNGRYADGTRIAPLTTDPDDETLKPVSGGEVMDAYLRALPQSLLRPSELRG